MCRGVLVLLAGLALAACGGAGAKPYSVAGVKSAYFQARDFSPLMQGYYQDPYDHSHTNYVPVGGLEVCPLAQRANYDTATVANAIEPKAAEPAPQFVVTPKSPDDTR